MRSASARALSWVSDTKDLSRGSVSAILEKVSSVWALAVCEPLSKAARHRLIAISKAKLKRRYQLKACQKTQF
jgi:muramidase (phage lysozyme)